ncbi:MAG: response regulator [Deltaproteobacteria bacterium]|nr:response regulator [Deltaproteobacteria bacterium]
MRVLLVDDEVEFVSTLAERLAIRGIEATYATTSAEALSCLESGDFDVAVLDVKMPKVGGLTLKKELEARRPGMKFIFLTGYGSEHDFKAISEHVGTDYYLVKPVDIDALIAKMEKIIKPERE